MVESQLVSSSLCRAGVLELKFAVWENAPRALESIATQKFQADIRLRLRLRLQIAHACQSRSRVVPDGTPVDV